MKLRVTMKDPDTLSDAVWEAVEKELAADKNLSPEDKEVLLESRHKRLYEKVSKWFQWGEYLTIEIDTDADTATVIKP